MINMVQVHKWEGYLLTSLFCRHILIRNIQVSKSCDYKSSAKAYLLLLTFQFGFFFNVCIQCVFVCKQRESVTLQNQNKILTRKVLRSPLTMHCFLSVGAMTLMADVDHFGSTLLTIVLKTLTSFTVLGSIVGTMEMKNILVGSNSKQSLHHFIELGYFLVW